MTRGELRAYCLSLEGAQETFPFGPDTTVFKAANGKIFAIVGGSPDDQPDELAVSVKCDPEIGEALRGQYDAVVPGYHLNKRHWITVTVGGDVPAARVRELVVDSLDLVAGRRK